MEDYAPSIFLRNWTVVAPYLCSKFRIFDKPILEQYVSQVEGGPHLLQSYLRATRNGLPPTTRDMHPFFQNLAITSTPSLQASLMNFHHDTSLRSILENDSISSSSRAHICSCSGKGNKAMVGCQAIYLFILHHTLYFHLSIAFSLQFDQPSTSSTFTCEWDMG